MMTSDSKFFFQRTILQGFGLFFNKQIYSQTSKFSKKFAAEIECSDSPKIKDCIKLVNVDRLLEVQQEILEDNPVAFGPKIPSDFVPMLPTEVKDSFEFQIDFVLGVNSEDDSLFLTTIRNSEEADKVTETEEEKTEEKDAEGKEETEETEDEDVEEPIERSTSKPILSIITSTTAKTTKASESTTESMTTTEKPMTTSSSTTSTSTTESSGGSESGEKEETSETEKDETVADSDEGADEGTEEGTEESEGDGEEDSTEEEKRRRRRKREVDDHMSKVVCPMLRFADSIVESNRSVYIYQLNEFSSYHDEIVFAFGYPLKHKNLYDADEIKFSKRVMKNWVQFASNG